MADYKLVDIEQLEAGLTATAEAIREHTGKEDLMKLEEMPAEIGEVFEAGKKSEWDSFWEAYQEKGKRSNYEFAFARNGWNDNTFIPKYDIVPIGTYTVTSMFQSCFVSNVAERMEHIGKILDTSGAKYFVQAFQASKSKRWPVISLENAIEAKYMFHGAECETIDLLISNENCKYDYAFYDANKLKNISFDGIIGNDINFQFSPLTKESIDSIISHLSDSTTNKTVTFSKTAVNAAFETVTGAADGASSEEWLALTATKSNWTISLV